MITVIFLWLLSQISYVGFWALLAVVIVANRSVLGTPLRHKMATAVVSLAWLVRVSSAMMVLTSAAEQDAINAFFALLRAVLAYFHWKRFKDEDNWWKGRGRKWLQSIDKAISKLSPNPAPA